jgi:tetratricopeptide (TPR) repeat protein
MWGLWTVHFLRGELEQALEVAGGVYDMAENARDPLLQVTGHHAIGYTHFYRGDYQQALHHAREGLALFDLERERAIASIFQFSSTLALRCFSSEALQMLGRFDEAEESLRQWRALIDELRHAPSRAYSLAQMCFFFHARYDAAEVRRLAAELRSLSIDEGFALWVPIADVHLAWAGAYLGDDANAAVSRILEAKAQIDQSLTHITELELVCELAETLLLAGRPEEVAPAIDAALAQAQRGRLGHFQPELLRLQGEAFSVMGDAERAKNWYRQALDAADRMGARALAERARSALGRARR